MELSAVGRGCNYKKAMNFSILAFGGLTAKTKTRLTDKKGGRDSGKSTAKKRHLLGASGERGTKREGLSSRGIASHAIIVGYRLRGGSIWNSTRRGGRSRS